MPFQLTTNFRCVALATLRHAIGILMLGALAWPYGCLAQEPALKWQALPAIPDALGLAGPIVGIHGPYLLAGGGANFAQPVWESTKQWHDELYVLKLGDQQAAWQSMGRFPFVRAYAACVSTPLGIVVIGGNDATTESNQCWLPRVTSDSRSNLTVTSFRLPDLPTPLVYAQAAYVAGRVVVVTGQTSSQLSSAIAGGWELHLSNIDLTAKPNATKSSSDRAWQAIPDCPGGPRAFAIVTRVRPSETVDQADSLLVIGGRRMSDSAVTFLSDVWQYNVLKRSWQQRASAPVAVSAGGGGPVAVDRVAIISGDDGSLFDATDRLRDQHPGFAKRSWLFDSASNTWSTGGATPANQVTTIPVSDGAQLILVSGEVRPRVRTNCVWRIGLESESSQSAKPK